MARGIGSPRMREKDEMPRQVCRIPTNFARAGMQPPQGWHMSCSCDGGLAGLLDLWHQMLPTGSAASGHGSHWRRELGVPVDGGWLILVWLGSWSCKSKPTPRKKEKMLPNRCGWIGLFRSGFAVRTRWASTNERVLILSAVLLHISTSARFISAHTWCLRSPEPCVLVL